MKGVCDWPYIFCKQGYSRPTCRWIKKKISKFSTQRGGGEDIVLSIIKILMTKMILKIVANKFLQTNIIEKSSEGRGIWVLLGIYMYSPSAVNLSRGSFRQYCRTHRGKTRFIPCFYMWNTLVFLGSGWCP